MSRKALSKRTRFEVFKRDSFRCSYCGRTPPAVVLHVDHVVPVSDGGTNEESNLVTACSECNQGKSNISLDVTPRAISERAEELREREDQLREYQQLLAAKRERLEKESWEVVDVLDGEGTESYPRAQLRAIAGFLEKLGFDLVVDSAEIASCKYPSGGRRTFLYFCGVCWNRFRSAGEGA